MSNKNTPIHARINNFITRNAAYSGNDGTVTPKTTASMRQRNINRLNIQEHGRKLKKDDDHTDNQLLNTGFSKSPSVVIANTMRLKPKSAVLNAFYTPSSLQRGVRSTPNSARCTPQSGRKSSINKVTTKATPVANYNAEEHNTEISNLTVAVRIRPLNTQECSRKCVTNVVRVFANELTVLAGTTADASAGVTHSFTYDHVFNSCDPDSVNFACQQDVFLETAQPLINRAFEGYNACLFAYGQTGSGKSYSMMGVEALDDDALDGVAPHPEAGIIPRFCHELFQRIEQIKHTVQAEIEVSYFEIYNEKIHDLLCVTEATHNNAWGASTPVQRKALKVREHPNWGPYVVDLSAHPVDSYKALRNWLAVGNSQRATAATGMNDKSSRSHSIFNIVLNLTELSDISSTSTSSDTCLGATPESYTITQTRRSKISLVDLAGSERINTSNTNGERIREGVSINKSLLTLGKVIAALADAKKHNSNATTFVPYRESVLTWLLRENLGGNSKTVMLATISPASLHIDETLATLRYACQARTIVNRVKINESAQDKTIRSLLAEVELLKARLHDCDRKQRLSGLSNPQPRKIIIETSVDDSEVEALRQQLSEREREIERQKKTWAERLEEAENLRKSELRLLQRRGLALELSGEHKVCLVNLIADPILSGTLFYLLPPGKVKIGRTRTSTYCTQPDIVLDGPLVGYHHCIIENENDKLYVIPENQEFETYLNGELVQESKQMFHGDRLVIGGTHYFRVSNPFCTQRNKNTPIVDYQLAQQEILQKQEEKLRRELEEEKRAALSRIELERAENERNYKVRMENLEFEQFRYQCNRDILETERKVFEEEQRAEMSDLMSYTPTFKSTLLEDINLIMQTPSEESLHKTQLMVREATEHCRNLNMHLKFRQAQVLDKYGVFHTAILIVDTENERKAEWPTARLAHWLERVRNADNLTAKTIFKGVAIEWEPLDDNELNETLNETLNSSRISLNLNIFKDANIKPKSPLSATSANRNIKVSTPIASSTISKSNLNAYNTKPEHLVKSALLNATQKCQTKKMLIYGDESLNTTTNQQSPNNACSSALSTSAAQSIAESFDATAAGYVRDMQRLALRLKKLYEQQNDQENKIHRGNHNTASEKILRESIERLESILQGMRSCLEQNLLVDSANDVSPSKTPKSVRFLID